MGLPVRIAAVSRMCLVVGRAETVYALSPTAPSRGPTPKDEVRRSKPIRAASSNSLSQGMSSSGELFTAGPPAIATCCAIHKRLPPALEPGGGAPPLSIYWPLSFLAHAAEIAPARITV